MSLKLSDLDAVTLNYSVVDQDGYDLGSKSDTRFYLLKEKPECGYIYFKPEYDKRGRPYGGKHSSLESRIYKKDPPWLKAEVIKIDTLGGVLTFHVQM